MNPTSQGQGLCPRKESQHPPWPERARPLIRNPAHPEVRGQDRNGPTLPRHGCGGPKGRGARRSASGGPTVPILAQRLLPGASVSLFPRVWWQPPLLRSFED